jgi:hypothetical protein
VFEHEFLRVQRVQQQVVLALRRDGTLESLEVDDITDLWT